MAGRWGVWVPVLVLQSTGEMTLGKSFPSVLFLFPDAVGFNLPGTVGFPTTWDFQF